MVAQRSRWCLAGHNDRSDCGVGDLCGLERVWVVVGGGLFAGGVVCTQFLSSGVWSDSDCGLGPEGGGDEVFGLPGAPLEGVLEGAAVDALRGGRKTGRLVSGCLETFGEGAAGGEIYLFLGGVCGGVYRCPAAGGMDRGSAGWAAGDSVEYGMWLGAGGVGGVVLLSVGLSGAVGQCAPEGRTIESIIAESATDCV